MTTKELIRQEIVRRIEWLNTATNDFAEGRRAELRSLYDFLDTLPDEPVEKTCKSCVFYENDCPFTRDKFMPYPNRVCKDYTFSTLKAEQEPESEDERIRKWIHKYIAVRLDDAGEFIGEYREALAWLEKQKGQKPKAKAKSPLSPHELYDAKIEGISQGRQDVIDHPEQFGLQKTAEWSEEDEDNLHRVIRVLEDNDSDWKELSDWLKSLRPQPKQGWSVEDELMIKCCFRAIEHYKYTWKRNVFRPSQFDIDGYLTSPEKVQTWLESLRNRVSKESLQS